MCDTVTNLHARRELARRVGGGFEITLYWSADLDRISVQVFNQASGETLEFTAAHERALDAFYHPFAHLTAPSDEQLVDWAAAA
jgi:hypothetical protein